MYESRQELAIRQAMSDVCVLCVMGVLESMVLSCMIGGGLVMLLGVRGIGVIGSIVGFGLSVYVWMEGNVESRWFRVDGLSVNLIVLTTLLSSICVWGVIDKCREVSIYLMMEGVLLCVFMVKDMLSFFICYESVLIPMYVLIGYGGVRSRSVKAGRYLLVYTLIGSVSMLLGIVIVYVESGSVCNDMIRSVELESRNIVWGLLFVGFMVKVPMVPVHIWLIEAHVEAPTEGSVILAGVMLKLGSYGIVRYNVELLGGGVEYFSGVVKALSIMGVVYGSLSAIRQTDMKRIVAYASIGHMNMTVLGAVSGTLEGVYGSVYQMMSHGVVSGGLFMSVGVLYGRMHSRQVYYVSGLSRCMPVMNGLWLVLILSNMGVPGTGGFVGEVLIMVGLVWENIWVSIIGGSSLILSSCYSLWLYNRVMGGVGNGVIVKDIGKEELWRLCIVCSVVMCMGVMPGAVLEKIEW